MISSKPGTLASAEPTILSLRWIPKKESDTEVTECGLGNRVSVADLRFRTLLTSVSKSFSELTVHTP